MEFDFSFEQNAWELALEAVPRGGSISAARLLTLLEGEEEDAAEEALELLEERCIALDISELRTEGGTGTLAQRLSREKQLVYSGTLLQSLEENDPLRLYLEELAGISAAGDPVLLGMRCADGDEGAREILVSLMLSQVVSLAMAQAGKGVLLLDLIQEGSLGLWQGVLCYTGGDIEEHCRWWIRQYQAKAIFLQARAGGTGQKLQEALEKYREADRYLLTKLGRNPVPEEIAAYLNISGEDVVFLEKMLSDARLQQQIKTQGKPEELPEEEDQSVENTAYFQSRQRIQELLSGLSEQDALLISLRYGLEGGLPLDPQQVGQKLGLTPEEVVQREAAALQKLRQQSET